MLRKYTLPVSNFFLYWNTIRHLKLIQFYTRLHRFLAPPVLNTSLPKLSLRLKTSIFTDPVRRSPSLISKNNFIFLSEIGSLKDIGWHGSSKEKLWRYNQHYFDDLNALRSKSRHSWHLNLLNSWLQSNPPNKTIGWEPYPTSLRIVNWIKWSLLGNQLPSDCISSLFLQARWMDKNLETHLLGNHLFANAKALIFAGLFFEGQEPNKWLIKGMRILKREIGEQILSDGGHFERSPMYHALILEDILDILNVLDCFSNDTANKFNLEKKVLHKITQKMIDWLQSMSHPDGEISFFNDSTLGVAPSINEINKYSKRLGLILAQRPDKMLVHNSDSGYIRLQIKNYILLLDVAPVGPNYIPGHAHADTLSFEMSLFGKRVFVNSGISCYGFSKERLRQRGTAAHNTVMVNNKNSSEVWSGFRVAKRAMPFDLNIVNLNKKSFIVTCSHDGYKSLRGSPIHRRKWILKEKSLVIEDEILGKIYPALAFFHFHPKIKIERNFPNKGFAKIGQKMIFEWEIEFGDVSFVSSTFHPRFGIAVPNECMTVKLKKGKSRLILNLK